MTVNSYYLIAEIPSQKAWQRYNRGVLLLNKSAEKVLIEIQKNLEKPIDPNSEKPKIPESSPVEKQVNPRSEKPRVKIQLRR